MCLKLWKQLASLNGLNWHYYHTKIHFDLYSNAKSEDSRNPQTVEIFLIKSIRVMCLHINAFKRFTMIKSLINFFLHLTPTLICKHTRSRKANWNRTRSSSIQRSFWHPCQYLSLFVFVVVSKSLLIYCFLFSRILLQHSPSRKPARQLWTKNLLGLNRVDEDEEPRCVQLTNQHKGAIRFIRKVNRHHFFSPCLLWNKFLLLISNWTFKERKIDFLIDEFQLYFFSSFSFSFYSTSSAFQFFRKPPWNILPFGFLWHFFYDFEFLWSRKIISLSLKYSLLLSLFGLN